MIDEAADWGLAVPVICGDGAYGDTTEFREGLTDREISYVLDVKGARLLRAIAVRSPRSRSWPWPLAPRRWRIENDYRELKDALGLNHFEGRSWRGRHHHTTLVSVAYAFLTLERRTRPPVRAAA